MRLSPLPRDQDLNPEPLQPRSGVPHRCPINGASPVELMPPTDGGSGASRTPKNLSAPAVFETVYRTSGSASTVSLPRCAGPRRDSNPGAIAGRGRTRPGLLAYRSTDQTRASASTHSATGARRSQSVYHAGRPELDRGSPFKLCVEPTSRCQVITPPAGARRTAHALLRL